MENYHILERIGEGSFGKVYRGRRKYSGQIVALKFVTKQGKSARDLENLRQEINILRRLNHCNIIAMLDSFETDGEFCMVTEYAQGELFQVLEDEHSLPEEEIKKIAIQLIQALHVLHSNRIIHRDMKPQNILIGSKQQIKLADFGFARAIAHDSSLLRSIKGTPLYMAPELVQEKPYNYTVDLWSLGVILYELAVGKPPFYTDRIVSLIQMIVRDAVQYPPTMSEDFQSFLKGLLNKDPTQRLKWPDILQHRFVQETPEQLEARLQLERQVRALPRFFKENEVHQSLEEESEEKVKPSIERLRSCDEWKACDPETGRQLAKPEQSHENGPKAPPAGDNNNRDPSPPPEAPRPVHSVVLDSFLNVWDRISREMGMKHVDAGLVSSPLFANAIGLLPSIPVHELSRDILTNIASLLHLLYRSFVLLLKRAEEVTQLDGLLHAKDHVHRFLSRLVEAGGVLKTGYEQATDVVYKCVRCCMICTTIVNSIEAENSLEGKFDYREFCKTDVDTISLMLTCKDVVAASHSKALKWLGSMIDRSQNLTTLLEVVYPSGVVQTLCEILHASGISRSPGGRISMSGRDLGLYAVFALAAFVQPDAKCWSPLQPFPVLTLVQDNAAPIENSSLRDVKHLYKLRVKVHSEVGSQLLSSGVSELIALLGDEINERVRQKRSEGGDTDGEDDLGEEDADQSTICCILKILMHACRSSAPLSKKLTVTKIVFQKHRDTDVFTILLWGFSSGGLHQIEQYFATELLSVILRRGVLPKRQIWRCAQTLFPLLQDASDTALLSALSTFFAEVIETCNIDESALGTDELEPEDMELWNLVVHGALTPRCSAAIFRLFSNNVTDEDDNPSSKAQMLTSYNIRAQGLLDSGIVFLLRVASKAASQPIQSATEGANRSEEMNIFMSVFESDNVWQVFDGMIAAGGGDLLSPWGLFCFLKLLRIVREMQCNETQMEVAVNEHLLLHLVNLLELKHIEYLFHWPEVVGGGSNAVKALVHATVKVLGIPFAHSVSEELLVDTQEILYDTKCVQKLLGVLQFVFSTKELHLETSVLELPISFLSRLVTSSTHFGSQFVEADGMSVIKECGMLSSNCSPSLIIDTLLIVSQLARSSQTNYDCILRAGLLTEFYHLMQHPEAMVRAKALNCIGNLCRHSTLFYRHFIAPIGGDPSRTVLNGMIRGLSDQDSYVRRFACFAIGNAAFHNGELYRALRPAIPLLVQNLHNDEEKTRSNAGGALGNLVRNSDELCSDLCAHEAPWELFELAMAETSTASRRIVLFSLGNLCVYPACFNFLVQAEPGFVQELEHLYDDVVADEVSRRNIRRILSKIEALESEGGDDFVHAE
ncbi:Serine/threonine-protein kinase [Phytophthora fragariae]|uniref:non-specific serine/threonine protein kinase n=1 Tax=Phytophthora fragariae TaxID=53985 RepID=A0A6A4BJW0_9STRA|nr:Serine/threonine-protein kinase [Phytophthora fragariae]KAE8922874.1 Serine/threonine-protein kinase [Phytophthora fragariae]KAE9072505.1 Serine/threonine-protein kinase [Phytophthora fragariae]KAE9081191.1 Serine/threonine-protein kinase [Phytophthora fragariae]KAE9197763.1 Serine/threonine-protein kinase [Phytophthora fragariae]